MGQNFLQRMAGAIPRTPGGIARTALSAATGIPAPMIKSAQGALNPARIPAAAVTQAVPFLGKGLAGGGLLFGALEGLAPARTGKGTLAENDPERYRSIVSMQNGGTLYSGDPDAGPGPVSQLRDRSQADYVSAPPAPQLPPEERAYQTELARTQQMAAANPYFQQMDLYAQGQRAMQTQEDMNQVRDLGLAINRSMYGDMTTPRTPNPLMAGLTPPGPAQPVIPMDEEGRIGQLDTAAAGVQDFMRKYAEGMKKRKGEE
jgi:hypothetical protein